MYEIVWSLKSILADINKATSFEDIIKLGETIESKEGSFLAPSYNINRVEAANDLIAHLNKVCSWNYFIKHRL